MERMLWFRMQAPLSRTQQNLHQMHPLQKLHCCRMMAWH